MLVTGRLKEMEFDKYVCAYTRRFQGPSQLFDLLNRAKNRKVTLPKSKISYDLIISVEVSDGNEVCGPCI